VTAVAAVQARQAGPNFLAVPPDLELSVEDAKRLWPFEPRLRIVVSVTSVLILFMIKGIFGIC
jgi:hypothetical protein